MGKVACFDFDGTLVTDSHPLIGSIRPDAVALLRRLKNNGWRIIIWSGRSNVPATMDELAQYPDFVRQYQDMLDWLEENEIEAEIWRGGVGKAKPNADVFIDDKSLNAQSNTLQHDFEELFG